MINENFLYVGLVITALGGLVYLIQTIRGKVQPNRVTWFLWGAAPLIAFSAQVDQGVGPQSLLTFILGFGPMLIFLASFLNKKSYWKVNKLDFVFGGFALLGLVLWQITGVGNIAIFFSILADGLAAVPTIIKSYHHPETENAFGYYTAAIGGTITLLTITDWNFQTFGFPLYVVVVCTILTLLIQFKVGKRISSTK